MNTLVKYLCLALMFFCFLLIWIQQLFGLNELKPLSGDFVPATYEKIDMTSWFSGDYQERTNAFVNDNFGFRNYLVRLNNQLRFWLAKKAKAKEVVIGKDNYMYVEGYINGYFGMDFIGEEAIRDSVTNLKFLQDTLQKMGKTLLIVMAPGKPRIYPEYLPDYYPDKPAEYSNYNAIISHFKKAGINHIDFNALFKIKKATSPYLLYPQLGVHWSKLEAVRAFDTIVAQLAYLSHTNLPRVKIAKVEVSDTLINPDEDIIEGMNLLYYPEYEKMAYPTYEYIFDNTVQKDLLLIGDSYWWDIYLEKMPREVFRFNTFWYYNKEAWSNYYFGKKDVKQLDVTRSILQNDYVVLICGESNYGALGFGFIGAATNSIKRKIIPSKDEINDLKDYINEIPEWKNQLPVKAAVRNISVDSMLTADATWLFYTKGPRIRKITIQDVKNSIDNSPDWLEDIIQHAKEANISIDSAKTEAARWYFDKEVKNKEKGVKPPALEEVKAMIRLNKEWMTDIRKKSKQNRISLEEQIEKDAKWYMDEMARK